ncbi:MAG: hypothetical protein GYA55_01685, partial [SAR324 cluster bacterium]|nr:hypothetical protein [SAR324 cluster bacterium]
PRLSLWKTVALLALTVFVTLLSAAFVYLIKFQIEETPWFTALLAGAFAYYVCGHMLPDLLNRVRSMPAKKYPAIITGAIGIIGMSLIMRWLDSGH